MKSSMPPIVTRGIPGARRAHRPLRRRGAARAIAEHPAEPAADAGLVEHPDGWYWIAPDGEQQFGPFETATLARSDRDRVNEQSVNEAEAEREAEQELGVGDAVEEERDAADPEGCQPLR